MAICVSLQWISSKKDGLGFNEMLLRELEVFRGISSLWLYPYREKVCIILIARHFVLIKYIS